MMLLQARKKWSMILLLLLPLARKVQKKKAVGL